MITQFVNQIEQHPETIFVQAEVTARMKRDTESSIAKRLRAIRAFWLKVAVRQPAASRNIRVQCGGVEQGGQTTV